MSHFLRTQCWDTDLQHWHTMVLFIWWLGNRTTGSSCQIGFFPPWRWDPFLWQCFMTYTICNQWDFDKLKISWLDKAVLPGKTNWNILTSHCWCTGTNPVYIPYILYPILWRCTSTIKTHVAKHLTLHPITINSIDYNKISLHSII